MSGQGDWRSKGHPKVSDNCAVTANCQLRKMTPPTWIVGGDDDSMEALDGTPQCDVSVQSLIALYEGSRGNHGNSSSGPSTAASCDVSSGTTSHRGSRGNSRERTASERRAAFVNGTAEQRPTHSDDVTIAKDCAGSPIPVARPQIVLLQSADSSFDKSPSPSVVSAARCWLLPLPDDMSVACRSRNNSSGSADSAVCDLNTVSENCGDSAQPGFKGQSWSEAGELSAWSIPSVIVRPGSPAVYSPADSIGDSRERGAESEEQMSTALAPSQPRLLLAVDSLKRKISNESICSEISECGSFSWESQMSTEDEQGPVEFIHFDTDQISWKSPCQQVVGVGTAASVSQSSTTAWVQLAGHKGTFLPFKFGHILKKHCVLEEKSLETLMVDTLQPFVPRFFGVINRDGEKYIEIQDLLAGFTEPSVMDCKIGVRTYLEDELDKALRNPQPRPDMYEKMIKVDANEPTPSEHQQRAVTKPRYMQWRERVSSSATFGFRIEAVRRADGSATTDFKKTKDRESIAREFLHFASGRRATLDAYVKRLHCLRRAMDGSRFLARHEVIGSSLLFVHDNFCADVWLIDFGKTAPLAPNVSITHTLPWVLGNHEDGYLTGVENLIGILSEACAAAALST